MEKIDKLKKGDKVKLNFLGLDHCNLTKVEVKDGDICTFIEKDGSYMELSLNGVQFKIEIYPDYHWEKVEELHKILLPDVLYLKCVNLTGRNFIKVGKVYKALIKDGLMIYGLQNDAGGVSDFWVSTILDNRFFEYATEAEYLAQDTRERIPLDDITMDNIHRVVGVELKPREIEQAHNFLKQGKVYDIFLNNMDLCFICELGEKTKPSEFSNILNAVLKDED